MDLLSLASPWLADVIYGMTTDTHSQMSPSSFIIVIHSFCSASRGYFLFRVCCRCSSADITVNNRTVQFSFRCVALGIPIANMLGWINDCVEKLVISEFDVKTWHIVKSKAGCTTADGGFLKLEHYPDKSTIDLVVAASEVSGLTVDQVLEAFGKFFVPYIIGEGYESLLCCQGSTMKDWMTNINAIHQHLQTTFPKKMIMPEFWCECETDGSLTLYYHSMRGNLLAPLAVGLVREVAARQFELDLVMDKLTTQDVEGAKFTS